ncbi:MAG: hypothetical protein IJO91_08180 [Oscillospiraceae bacterium]|nr:hypothetical protein [Oscillospiraceae bacterium]
MRLYGKTTLKGQLDSIAQQHRLPHAILLYGERGAGKRTMANYIAKLFMCGAPPCDSCAVCGKIDSDAHPDIIFVKRECGGKYNLSEDGKNGLVSMRRVMESVVIKPNDGDVKIYIFEDCDDMSAIIQNTLLKLIEEPAPFLRFIFTCENTDTVLETIRSRVTEFEVPTASPEECAQCLIDNGHPADRSQELSQMLSGNIGKCLDVLSGGGDTPFMECAQRAASAIARKDGYSCAAALSEQTGRAEFASMLGYLTEILRDALAARCGAVLTSCGREEAKAVAKSHNEEQILSMLDAVFEAAEDSALNLNLSLTASYLTSKFI